MEREKVMEKVMESHGIWRTQKSTNLVIWKNIWVTLVSSFFQLHTLKVSATALPEGAFLVYLNLKKATRHPDPDEYPRHFF